MDAVRAMDRQASVARLLDATAELLRREGAAGVSVQRVADAAGTSKGLVHYHFAGKDELLAACAERLAEQLASAERHALELSDASSALDDLWRTLTTPATRGAHRALLALSHEVTPAAQAAYARSRAVRRSVALEVLGGVEQVMGLRFGARRAIADAYMAVTDGIALSGADPASASDRAAYDAFWLAVLTLAG